VLHGVQQHFPESEDQVLAVVVALIGGQLAHELRDALGGQQAARDAEADPVGRGRSHLDRVAPALVAERRVQQAGQLDPVDRLGETGERLRAQHREDVLGGRARGQDDVADARADGADLVEEREILRDGRARTGDDRVEGRAPQPPQGIRAAGGRGRLEGRPARQPADRFQERGVFADEQDGGHLSRRRWRRSTMMTRAGRLL
jgi:hypothetical protein